MEEKIDIFNDLSFEELMQLADLSSNNNETLQEEKENLESEVIVRETRDFTMLDNKVNFKLSKEKFTQSETTLFFVILSHLGFDKLACHLVMKNGINASAFLTTNDLKRLCDFKSNSTLERAIRGLLAKEIIKIDIIDNRRIYLANPFIFYRGKNNKVPKKYVKLFEDTKWFNY